MCERLERAINSLTAGLRVLPDIGEPGYPSAYEFATELAVTLSIRLRSSERMILATAAILSLDRANAEELAETTISHLRTGLPVAPFTTLREEARNWAALASPGELRAYLGAIWGRLSEAERVSFLRAARPKQRAAA